MSTAIARNSNETPSQALSRVLNAGKKQIEIAVGKAMDPNRMIRLATSALHQTPELQECSMVSIVNSVMLAAQLRLEINTSLGHAWLIPYKKVCTFQPGYRGLIELAHRSSLIHDVSAHMVFSADEFEIEYGDSPRCYHKPKIAGGRGQRVGAYAIIRYKDGPANFLFMGGEEIEEIRDKASQSKNSEFSPWKKYPDEMWRKTPTKRLLKYIRLSIEDLSRAIGLDEQAESVADRNAVDISAKALNPATNLSQDLVIEGEMLDMAETATHELRGSADRQQQVAEEKIASMQKRQPTSQASSTPKTQEEIDEENRRLDAEIMQREQGQGEQSAKSGSKKLRF
jgi:recombination protein RecT